jgi:hypothetical protein
MKDDAESGNGKQKHKHLTKNQKQLCVITVKVKQEAKKVGTVKRVMRQSTAIPEPSFWLVRSGDAKIDCRILRYMY